MSRVTDPADYEGEEHEVIEGPKEKEQEANGAERVVGDTDVQRSKDENAQNQNDVDAVFNADQDGNKEKPEPAFLVGPGQYGEGDGETLEEKDKQHSHGRLPSKGDEHDNASKEEYDDDCECEDVPSVKEMCEAIARHRRDLGAKRESAQQADKTDITLHLGSEPPTDDAGLPTTAADGKVDTQDGVPVPVDDEGQQDGEEMSSDLGDEVELVATRTVSESDEPDPFDGEDCGLYLLFAEGVGQGGMQEEKEVDGSEDGDRTPDQEQPSGLLAPPSSDTEDGEGLKQRHREVDTDDDDASEDEGQHRPAKRARTGERRWCAVM